MIRRKIDLDPNVFPTGLIVFKLKIGMWTWWNVNEWIQKENLMKRKKLRVHEDWTVYEWKNNMEFIFKNRVICDHNEEIYYAYYYIRNYLMKGI